MKIKQGDTVIVISGSRNDKGKTGKVLQVLKADNKIVVEGINIKKKVTRDPNGAKKMVDVEYPLHASNVMFYDDKAKAGSRIGSTKVDGKNVRVTKKSGTQIK